jgi:hypothetical protein
MTSPRQGNRIPPEAIWAADNGRYPPGGKGWPGHEKYARWLAKLAPIADRCAFALAPDVPFDMAATLEFSEPYIGLIRDLGLPVALALQNGAEGLELPWDSFDVAFIAGDTEWKLGFAATELAREAQRRGKRSHLGRVNGGGRLAFAWGAGYDTADGTTFAWGPDDNAGDMARWIGDLERKGIQGVLA